MKQNTKLRKSVFVTMFLLLTINTCFAISLYEIYPNPINSEEKGEYIDIYTDSDINLKDYIIQTPKENIALPNFNLPKGFYYLIAEENFIKDNSSWPDQDFNVSLLLRNSDGFVKIIDKNNKTMDEINWSSSREGLSIRKESISTNNTNISQKPPYNVVFRNPDPKNIETSHNKINMNISLSINNNSFSYNLPEKIVFIPNKENWINFTFQTFCQNITKIFWLDDEDSFNGEGTYTIKRKITRYTKPGNYNISVSYCNINKTINFTVLPVISISQEKEKENCTFSEINNKCIIKNTIENTGNVDVVLNIDYNGYNNCISLKDYNEIKNNILPVGEKMTLNFVFNKPENLLENLINRKEEDYVITIQSIKKDN